MRGLHQFERRVRRLESHAVLRASHDAFLIVAQSVSPDSVSSGQRIVVDRVRDSGNIVWARERLTSDLGDMGRSCPKGGYCEDGLLELHQTCHWRSSGGACRMCQGTPVADTPKPGRKVQQK